MQLPIALPQTRDNLRHLDVPNPCRVSHCRIVDTRADCVIEDENDPCVATAEPVCGYKSGAARGQGPLKLKTLVSQTEQGANTGGYVAVGEPRKTARADRLCQCMRAESSRPPYPRGSELRGLRQRALAMDVQPMNSGSALVSISCPQHCAALGANLDGRLCPISGKGGGVVEPCALPWWPAPSGLRLFDFATRHLKQPPQRGAHGQPIRTQ